MGDNKTVSNTINNSEAASQKDMICEGEFLH